MMLTTIRANNIIAPTRFNNCLLTLRFVLKYIATVYNELNLLKLIIALIFLSNAKILKIFEKPNFSVRKSALYLIFIANKYIIALFL